jgi:hypothetical protein
MAALSLHDTAVVPAVPLPLEQYAQDVAELFHPHIQRRRFREYLAGLLVPRDRNKTLTALVGAEPLVQAQTAPVQQVQDFLSESDWDAEAVTARRSEELRAARLTRPHADGRRPTVRWSSRRPATARMGRPPPTSAPTTWAASARSATGLWP